jgi:hypothetical protein
VTTRLERKILSAVSAYYGGGGCSGDLDHALRSIARDIVRKHGSKRVRKAIEQDEELSDKIARVMRGERLTDAESRQMYMEFVAK